MSVIEICTTMVIFSYRTFWTDIPDTLSLINFVRSYRVFVRVYLRIKRLEMFFIHVYGKFIKINEKYH